MPLMHQLDNGHGGGGGSSDNRRSLADFVGLDTAQLMEATAPRISHRNNGSDEWRWEPAPGSPEAAQTPASFVPATCFPPTHPRAFASYSESARPGGGWPEDAPAEPMSDLVTSLKALSMPATSIHASLQVRLSYDKLDRVDSWSQERKTSKEVALPRRASFCGSGSPWISLSPARWLGSLPPRSLDASGPFSSKVFLGGVPWDITEQALLHTFRHFQPVRVEWPVGAPRGYAYLTLHNEKRVRALLAAARRDRAGWYYRVPTRSVRTKEVQIIPWSVSDSNCVVGGAARLDPARTVFVGALHGMLSAAALAAIMDQLFHGVVYAGIDTDKTKYPIGSGRVTFNNVRSYIRAISAGFVEICTDKFEKKVQVDPYLEDSMCSVCNLQQGPYFCREPVCFRYFCRSCWNWQHSAEAHTRLMRSSKCRDHAPPDTRNNDSTPSPSSGSGTSSLETPGDDAHDAWQ